MAKTKSGYRLRYRAVDGYFTRTCATKNLASAIGDQLGYVEATADYLVSDGLVVLVDVEPFGDAPYEDCFLALGAQVNEYLREADAKRAAAQEVR